MSGLIQKQFINDLLARTDIVSIIDKRLPLKKAGRNFSACCPFHQEKTPSFTVSPGKQFYHCFGCGAHGTAIGFLMEYERLSFPEAIETLAAELGMEVAYEGKPVTYDPSGRLHAVLLHACTYYKQQLKNSPTAIQYLKNRGISGDAAAAFAIGYAPTGWDHLFKKLHAENIPVNDMLDAGLIIKNDQGGYYDRFRERIMFPIRDNRGRIIGFGGRTLNNQDKAKYLNSPESFVFHKSRELYGLYESRKHQPSPDYLLVVEGYMDVISLAQHKIYNAVATLGTATSEEHVGKLLRHCRIIIFCFDGDRAGRQAAWRALEVSLPNMLSGSRIQFLFLPENEDPDSLIRKEGRENFIARIAQAQDLSDYLFEHLKQKSDIKTLEGRATLIKLATPLIDTVKDPIYKQLLRGQLAQLTGLPESVLSQQSLEPKTKPHSSSIHPAKSRKLQMDDTRLSIAALLEQPSLALTINSLDKLKQLNRPGVSLLIELIELIRQTPEITTAALLHHYTATEYDKALMKLAAYEFILDNEAGNSIADIFYASIQKLLEKTNKQRYAELIKKDWKSLTPAEREELNTLGKQRFAHPDQP